MTGHRRGAAADGGLRPTRRAARTIDFLAKLDAAPTVEAQLAVAFDYFRCAAFRHPDRQAELHAMATELANRARLLEEATP